jgi:signal transduction histidine kinase/ActR/RegA family two-component response regulator
VASGWGLGGSAAQRRSPWPVAALVLQTAGLIAIAPFVGGWLALPLVALAVIGSTVAFERAFSGGRLGDSHHEERTRLLHQIAAGAPLTRVLDDIATFGSNLTECDLVILLLESDADAARDAERIRLVPLAAVGIDETRAQHIASGCGAQAVLARTIRSANLAEIGASGIVVAHPIIDSRGEPIGAVAIVDPSGAIAERTRCELAGVADLVSMAMSRTRADAATHSLVEDLEARNADLERLHQEAESAKAKAEDAARVKSEFLANMSHELRTPMTAILGFADLIERDGRGESDAVERRDHAATIRRSGEHLLALINDILDYSKIEAGRMSIECAEMSPLQAMGDAIAMLRDRARAKGLAIVTRIDGAVPVRVQSDPTRLRQILINLIGNAIKFTEHGEIIVRAAMLTAPSDPRPRFVFEVTDTGIGIDRDVIGRLFVPFTQADGSMARRFGGTGLGLAICKHLCGMLGGEIAVESEVGRGSTFRFTFETGPLGGVPMIAGLDALNQRPVESAGGFAGPTRVRGRILFADDSLDNQRLIAFHLRRAGGEVEVASDGREAVRKALESLTDPRGPYDLVLMDMQMPELDGYQATAALRTRGWSGPIVALTAHASPNERERCTEAGCCDFAAKPISRDALLDLCSKWLADGSDRALRRAA